MSTTQSKTFGAHAVFVVDAPNSLHSAADVVVSHCVHPVVPTAVNAPVVAIHAAPVVWSTPPPLPRVASLFEIKINPRATETNVVVVFRIQSR